MWENARAGARLSLEWSEQGRPALRPYRKRAQNADSVCTLGYTATPPPQIWPAQKQKDSKYLSREALPETSPVIFCLSLERPSSQPA